MKEDLITFETAKLAQEKKFPQDLFNTPWYNELGSLLGRTDLNKKGQTFTEAYPDEDSFYGSAKKPEHKLEFKLESYTAPTQSLLKKWLLESKNINIEITFDDGVWLIYVGEFSFPDSSVELVGSIECDNFKDAINKKTIAREKGLQEALKII